MFDAIGSFFGFIMEPLYFVTSFILSTFHNAIGEVLDPAGGASWALSIVGLTLVIRAALIPLFVKQIKSSRNMQLIQPRVRELQKKYKHDRERLAQEQMKLYRETKTNPFAACLPLLLQMPIFIALFQLIDKASKGQARGVLTEAQVNQLSEATLFGAPIASTFIGASGDTALEVRLLAAVLVIAMTATTFLTQRQLMTKNMPADALQGQYAQQQKMLLYILPLVFAVGGVAFPIGVLIYWTTSNLWTMCQQFYVIRNNPVPGTPAAQAKEDRDKAKRRRKGLPEEPEEAATLAATEEPPAPPPPRQQPKKQTREQRKKQAPKPNPQHGQGRQGPKAGQKPSQRPKARRPGPSEQKNPD